MRTEMERLEGVNNNLQGYGLDDLRDAELTNLINSLTQARPCKHMQSIVDQLPSIQFC